MANCVNCKQDLALHSFLMLKQCSSVIQTRINQRKTLTQIQAAREIERLKLVRFLTEEK